MPSFANPRTELFGRMEDVAAQPVGKEVARCPSPIASRHAPQPSRLPDDFLEHVPRRSSFGDMPCLAEGPDSPDSEPSKDFGDGTWAGPAPKGQ